MKMTSNKTMEEDLKDKKWNISETTGQIFPKFKT